MPSSVLDGKTPYEILFKAKPSYDHIRTFGCLCYVYANQKPEDKFGDRSQKCVFIGYPFGKKGWRVYDLENGHIFTSRDVVFCEEHFSFSDKSMMPDTLDQNLAPSPPVHDYESEPMFTPKSPPNHATRPATEARLMSSTATSRGGQGVDRPVATTGPIPGPELLPGNRHVNGPAAVDGPTPGLDMLPGHGPDAAGGSPRSRSESPRAGNNDPSGPHEPTRNAPAAQPNDCAEPDHHKRSRWAPSHLQDYIYYTASLKDPSTRALPL